MTRPPLRSTLFPYTTLFRSSVRRERPPRLDACGRADPLLTRVLPSVGRRVRRGVAADVRAGPGGEDQDPLQRSEEHTSELQSHSDLVCRLLLEKKKKKYKQK